MNFEIKNILPTLVALSAPVLAADEHTWELGGVYEHVDADIPGDTVYDAHVRYYLVPLSYSDDLPRLETAEFDRYSQVDFSFRKTDGDYRVGDETYGIAYKHRSDGSANVFGIKYEMNESFGFSEMGWMAQTDTEMLSLDYGYFLTNNWIIGAEVGRVEIDSYLNEILAYAYSIDSKYLLRVSDNQWVAIEGEFGIFEEKDDTLIARDSINDISVYSKAQSKWHATIGLAYYMSDGVRIGFEYRAFEDDNHDEAEISFSQFITESTELMVAFERRFVDSNNYYFSDIDTYKAGLTFRF